MPLSCTLESVILGVWAAQSVGRLTLDTGSGHDLEVLGIEPRIGLRTSVWRLLGILSLPLPCWHTDSLSLKINKLKKRKKEMVVE